MHKPLLFGLVGSAAIASASKGFGSPAFVNPVMIKSRNKLETYNNDIFTRNSHSSDALITEKTTLGNAHERPVVAVLDCFNDRNRLGPVTISHGELVKTFIKSKLPDTEVLDYNIMNPKKIGNNALPKSQISINKINNSLDQILEQINNGKKIDAINLSFIHGIKYDSIADKIQDKKAAKNFIKDLTNLSVEKQLNEDEELEFNKLKYEKRLILKTLEKMEEIIKKGTQIYVSAGNYRDYINVLSFAEGVKTIGATDSQGKDLPFYSHNSFVDETAQGIFNISPIKEDGKLLGFDLTGSNKPEIKYPEELQGSKVLRGYDPTAIISPPESGIGPLFDPDRSGRPSLLTVLKGTSFSTPLALVRGVLKKQQVNGN